MLYNKYRPKSFTSDLLLGHKQKLAAKALMKAISTGTMPTSILFSGPSGVGKTTLARIYAAAVNCALAKGGDPCSKCPTCISVLEGECRGLYTIIDGSVETGIDAMRGILSSLSAPSLFNTRKNYRCIVLDEMHNLSRQAQESLLTIVENPPVDIIFILCTTAPEKVLLTLRTRCLHIQLSSPSMESKADLVKQILSHELPESPIQPHIVEQLSSMSSVREMINSLENYILSGEVSDEVGVAPKQPAFRTIARLLVTQKRVSPKEAAELLTECRADPEAARAGITEYLHSFLLRELLAGKSYSSMAYVEELITKIGEEKTPLPGLFTVRLLPMIVQGMYKTVPASVSYGVQYKVQESKAQDILFD